jgi:hypothetical protein
MLLLFYVVSTNGYIHTREQSNKRNIKNMPSLRTLEMKKEKIELIELARGLLYLYVMGSGEVQCVWYKIMKMA